MLLGGISVLSVLVAVILCLCFGAFSGLGWIWLLIVGFLGSFLVLAGLFFLFFWLMCSIVDLNKEQEEDDPFYRFLIRLAAEAALTVCQTKVHTKGLEKTPSDGRFLLVCNHLNDMDPVVLLHYFRKSQLAFISKRENSGMFLVGKIMHKILCQPINRENDREALKTILKCIRIIQEDKASIAVFPEGYTSRDHKFHGFRSGVFKIAQKAKVPIVVCTVTNTYHIFHNALRLKPTHVDLHLVGVVQPEEFADITTVELGAHIHAMMARDLGPDYAPEENT